MFLADKLDHPDLKALLRQVKAQSYLFKAGDPGHTMFVVLNGIIVIVDESSGKEAVLTTLGPGHLFGEKAIIREQNFPRAYSAKVRVDALLLEFGRNDLATVQEIIPDLVMRVFESSASRLDRANELLKVLRPMDADTRFMQALHYFSLYSARKASDGKVEGLELLISPDDIAQLTGVETAQIDNKLKELITKKTLVKRPNGYLISHENLEKLYGKRMNEEKKEAA